MTKMGFFINRVNTPLEKINWTKLKDKGISEVYVRCVDENYQAISKHLPKIKEAGIKPYAWTMVEERFPKVKFTKVKEVTALGWNVCHDVESYHMIKYLDEIKAFQAACKSNGKTFILCTKPHGWDGDMSWSVLKDYCDYLMPMLYLGDYKKTLAQLGEYMKEYDSKYPDKIYPALETYISDNNTQPKSNADLRKEIDIVAPYSAGIALFRYGISNY